MLDSVTLLLPRPRQATTPGGGFLLPDRPTLALKGAVTGMARQRVTAELEALGVRPRVVNEQEADVRLEIDPALDKPESYQLEIRSSGIKLRAADPPGLYYGASTLAQWLRIHLLGQGHGPRTVPGLEVSDRPEFVHRGVMLDISRNKVPTLDTLKQLVDMLAGWKINQLQLYMENTFAYRGHEVVWQDADPLTPAEVRQLDKYCRARFIELVPNQNSFGHFHRWLVHEPYRQLAETPEGVEHAFSVEIEPFSLCPVDPGSLELLADLYDQLLPCFSSRLFNVGLDETFDLGLGRSAAACEEHGKGKVYLDFLTQVHRLVTERGHRMQFWGDIILQHPELLRDLPEDAIALEWGYEADHPFAVDSRRFAASGLDFYVCPGTSSWSSFAGRTRNAVENLAAAAIQGAAQGAIGYLIADWGDHGHLQPLPVSYPGFAAGAAFAWNAKTAQEPQRVPLAQWLDLHAFRDRGGQAGVAAVDLGDAYLHSGTEIVNGSALFFALVFAHQTAAKRRGNGMTAPHLDRTREHVEHAVASLAAARMQRPDADVIQRELAWVADALLLACRLATARLETGEEKPLSALPNGVRRAVAGELDTLIERLREVWLARNRAGGLDSSTSRLRHVQQSLAAP